MSKTKLFVCIGSGPGVGVATASLFASKGFNIALLSRNSQRLEQDAKTVRKSAASGDVEVRTFSVDVGDHIALKKTLTQVEENMGSPEVVLFNAARVSTSAIGETEPEFILDDLKTMGVGLFVSASWALPLLTETARDKRTHPSFFITSSGLWDHPFPTHVSLSMGKGLQYNFAGSLSQVAGPKGIHVGTINIGGVVAEEDPVINPKNIADHAWKLYEQDSDNWQSETKIGNIEDMIEQMKGK